MKISKNSQRLRIVTTGFPSALVFIIPSTLYGFLCIFLIFWLLQDLNWFILTLCIAVLPFFALAHYALIGSRICIDVDANRLTVKRGPISYLGDKELLSKTLKLIYYQPFVPYQIKPKLVIPTKNPFSLSPWVDKTIRLSFTTYKIGS
jgi:hypothetical protein